MARPYNKKSDYWFNRKQVASQPIPEPQKQVSHQSPDPGLQPVFSEGPHFSAVAALGGGAGGTTNNVSYRNNISPVVRGGEGSPFPLLGNGLVPFEMMAGDGRNGFGGNGSYSMAGPISLCMKAYWNYALARNCINMQVDYSLGKLKILTDHVTVKNFFTNWFQSIQLNNFMSQYFLEYYRGGNVFIYKFNGKIRDEDFTKMKTALAAKSQTVPIRYIIINPLQVFLQLGANTPNSYIRALSPFEITRLNHPQTPEDKQIFDQLPEATKKSIKQGGSWLFVTIPLDPERLYFCFYRKQDYEPLAVPPIYPVLNDIEFKLLLKKMDMSLAATMEQVILLVTTGQKADEYNQATGKRALEALQNLFQNQTIGRVLVADYTTKAEWKIPDLKELLGEEKYKRVDIDIKEGLQYIFFGEEKFANASLKVQVFIDSLKEGRRVFLENFLMPEVNKLCEDMNFKSVPVLEFENIQIQDQAIMSKLYYQMGQLGLLTAEEVNEAIKTGTLPEQSESIKSQEEYKKLRDKGLYLPLLGVPQDGGEGSPGGKGGKKPKSAKTPIGQKKASEGFGMQKLANNLLAISNLQNNVESALMQKFNITELNDIQKVVASNISKSIAINEVDETTWQDSIPEYIKKPKDISDEVKAELINIQSEFEVDSVMATVLKMSKVEVSVEQE